MNKKELTDQQYNQIADHIVRLYEEQSYYVDEDWCDIFDFVYSLDSEISVSIMMRHSDDGHEIIIVEDEYHNKEKGWKITCHYCTLLEFIATDKDMNDLKYNLNRRKLELLVEEKLPLYNSDL